MGMMLDALLRLQAVERDLTQVSRRLQARKNAVAVQRRKIDQLVADHKAMLEKNLNRRKDADRIELDLRQKEEHVAKFRTALNSARTNKEYAAILTEINTHKADNAKLEEEALRIIQDADTIRAEADKLKAQIDQEQQRLTEVQASHEQEVARLNELMGQLVAKRAAAAAQVPSEALAIFERMSPTYEGEAMAVIEVHGRKAPYDYVCGGCFMSLNAEHANVLRVRDEIRTCDNCHRILYLEKQPEHSRQAQTD